MHVAGLVRAALHAVSAARLQDLLDDLVALAVVGCADDHIIRPPVDLVGVLDHGVDECKVHVCSAARLRWSLWLTHGCAGSLHVPRVQEKVTVITGPCVRLRDVVCVDEIPDDVVEHQRTS